MAARPVSGQDGSTAEQSSLPADLPIPKWWQRITLAVGPGVRADRLADGTLEAESLVVNVVPLNRFLRGEWPGGGPSRQWTPVFRVNLWALRTDVVGDITADAAPLGQITLRPLMAGLRWSRPIRRSLTGELFGVVGYSLNDFNPDAAGASRSNARVALTAAPITIENTPAWEAGGRLWLEVHKRIALTTGASFLGTRPRLTFADGSTGSWNGNRVRVETGVVFTILQGR